MDFTLRAYRGYLDTIRDNGFEFTRFREYMNGNRPTGKSCLVRHDVDRKPDNALAMAQLERDMGIMATYYFRVKPNVFRPDLIRAVHRMGHEIGYHYESLSDCNGDVDRAVADFRSNLERLRAIVPVRTCAMHGRPLKPYDNRDMWRNCENHELLINELNLLGEVYLDIDYANIAYITDTGRNWRGTKANLRDRVASRVDTDFDTREQMQDFLSTTAARTLVFQIHPERWTDETVEWLMQYAQDRTINAAKTIFSLLRR